MRDAGELTEATTLSKRQAKVVVRRVAGQTFEEIGEELGIEAGTANEHWQRAKKKAATARESVEVFRDVGLLD